MPNMAEVTPSVITIPVGMIRLVKGGVTNLILYMAISRTQQTRLFDYFLLPIQVNGMPASFTGTGGRDNASRGRRKPPFKPMCLTGEIGTLSGLH
jgi:hypothetical protein